jgi:hypothetical protein
MHKRELKGARSGARPSTGQATVEFALVLPIVVMFIRAVFQIALIARDQVLATHAARVAVREASLGAPADRVEAAARHVVDDAGVEIERGAHVGDDVTVTVKFTSKTSVPLIGVFFPDVGMSADATMRREK